MSTRTRLIVVFASVPVITFTLLGGFLGRVASGEDTYRHLRVFEDVVSLISTNYVEPVDLDVVMEGALRGLAEVLDADSSYLLREDVDRIEAGQPLPEGRVGLEVTRRYYIQVVAAHDNSPAEEVGILPGDFIRAIDDEPTRMMSAVKGARLLHGEPGSTVTLSLVRGSTAEPYDVDLVRERLAQPGVSGRLLTGNVGYVRVSSFKPGTADELVATITRLTETGATSLAIDIRNNASGSYEEGVAAARRFVDSGTLVLREEHGDRRTPIDATGIDTIDTSAVVLINAGTAGPAELFAEALAGSKRAETIGQRTAGRASLQKLVRLPNGTGLWLSWARYLKASGDPLDRNGVEPDIAVDFHMVELGEPLPSDDTILELALDHLATSL